MKKLIAMITALIMILSAAGAAAEKGFTIQEVKLDTATLAKAAVPEGYQMYTTVNLCDEETDLGYPLRVSVGVADMNNSAMMVYYRGENYIHRVSHSYFDQNDYTTLEGDHVKVSTSYDYVYQSGSSVYFTNDALSIPSNATMLTPN